MKGLKKIFQNAGAKKAIGIVVFVGLVSFFCIRFYSSNLKSFPSHVHAWAQADRYALALNFQENGFDLFHPKTFNLRPQFPAKDSTRIETGITQVDCPIHEYIIAIIMTAIGDNSPQVFRWYNLLYGIIGFLFLFLLVRNNTLSHIKSIAVVIFAFLSPVLVFYLDGFLPSTTSVGSALIGYYFYFEFRKNKLFSNLIFAVVFATIAALSRTPFALILGAMGLQLLIDMIGMRKAEVKKLVPFIVAFGILIGYFIYNRMLASAYGSVFLTHLMPVSSFAEFKENLVFIYHNWSTSYFTVFHYITLVLFGVAFLIQTIRKRKLSEFQRSLLVQSALTFLVSVLYFVLMVKQFHSHDYYFLDSFYIPLLLIFVMFIDAIDLRSSASKVFAVGFILLFGYFSYGKCREDMATRYAVDPNSRALSEVNSFSGSKEYLDSLGISRDSKILVIEAYSANIPLILMDRKGYTVIGSNQENINSFFSRSFDYVVMQNEIMLAEVVNYYPEIIDELEPISTNGKISVFKKQYGKKNLLEFLQIKDEIIYCTSSCVEKMDSCNEILSDNISCDSSLILNPVNEFADVIELDLSQYKRKELSLIFIAEARLTLFNHDNTDLVATLNNEKGQIFYKSFALNQYLGNKVSGDFRRLYFMYPLSHNNEGNIKLKLYIWNNGKNEIELKNLSILISGKSL